jgi:hypothetical protein
MFEKYLLVRHDFMNVSQNGQIIGFQVKIKIPYYRGVYLSQIESVKLKVNDEEFNSDVMTLSVPEHGPKIPDSPMKTYTFKELATATTSRWFFGDAAILTVKKPGGLKPGCYTVQLALRARNSYVPRTDPEGLWDFSGMFAQGGGRVSGSGSQGETAGRGGGTPVIPGQPITGAQGPGSQGYLVQQKMTLVM